MKGIIINQDTDGQLRSYNEKPFTEQELRDFFLQFKDTHITDYFLCVYSQTAIYPSKVCESMLDKYNFFLEKDGKVDDVHLNAMNHIFNDLKIDHIAVSIDALREAGINPWISYRMNDVHYLAEHFFYKNESHMLDKFYKKHPELQRVKFHPEFVHTNADFSLDFTYDLVRERMLAIIDESIERYDPYGIELDFQREMDLFGIGYEYEGIDIMNQFFREVDAITKKYEAKFGHEIKVAVHVCPDVQTNIDFGLDIMQWVAEGIVDLVIPGCRYESNDNDMPIRLWSTLLKPYGVKLAAGIETNLIPAGGHHAVTPNIETYAACAHSAYDQGADKIYFYNYFRHNLYERFDKNAPYIEDPDRLAWEHDQYWTVLNTFGEPEKVAEFNRRHTTSTKDKMPLWKRNTNIAGENRGINQLPLTVTRDAGLKFHVGKIPPEAEVIFRFAVENDEESLENLPRVFINSEACEFIGADMDERWHRGTKLFSYKVPSSAFKSIICPYIIIKQKTTFTYADVFVKVHN
ncbi:MAG: hypothetical protein IJY93_03770 [Clostridia bacterium]|nr:hypothetical protein [Clostridia bacterium]